MMSFFVAGAAWLAASAGRSNTAAMAAAIRLFMTVPFDRASSRGCEPSIDPVTRVVIEVLHRVGVLPRDRFAGNTRRLSVFGAFDDHEVLISACRKLIVDFVVAHEIVPAHRRDQQRHANVRQMTRGR